MVVVQVMHSHGPGSVERLVVMLCRQLHARGHAVYLACPGRSWMWDAVEGSGVQAFHVPMDGLLDISSVARLSRLLRQADATIVHAHQTRGAYYASKAARRTGIPCVASAHLPNSFKHYARADAVLCSCEATRQNLIRAGIPGPRLRLLADAVETLPPLDGATRKSIRAEIGVPTGAKLVGAFGRYGPDKGWETLVEVASAWAGSDAKTHFVFSGVSGHADSHDASAIEPFLKLASENRLAGTCHSAPAARRFADLLRACDAVAVPSRHADSPLAALEPMAAGVPVVASDVPGLREVLSQDDSGILVPPGDVGAWGDALLRALADSDRVQAAGSAQRTSAQRYSPRAMVDAVEDIYERLVAPRRRAA